jgi:hypothetical protein
MGQFMVPGTHGWFVQYGDAFIMPDGGFCGLPFQRSTSMQCRVDVALHGNTMETEDETCISTPGLHRTQRIADH